MADVLMFHNSAFAYVMCHCGRVFEAFGTDAYERTRADIDEHEKDCQPYQDALKAMTAGADGVVLD